MDHEASIAVYYTEAIGQLIDVILELDYLTMTGFKWLPFEVSQYQCRKKTLKMRQLNRDWLRGSNYVNE